MILDLDPDVLCLDIIMPRMDGLSFLKKIMRYKPVPTIIVSTIAKKGSEMRIKVLEAGAVDVVDKEDLDLYQRKEAVAETLLPLLRKAALSTIGKVS
jgi:two-component system chemotaxis response regulator CheB